MGHPYIMLLARYFCVSPNLINTVQGFLNIVELLISAGADVDSLSGDGCSPLYYAVLGRHLPVVKLLISKGCDINQPDLEGTSPLHGSAQVGSMDSCKLLVEAGANISAEDNLGRTTAALAKEMGLVEMMSYLEDIKKA